MRYCLNGTLVAWVVPLDLASANLTWWSYFFSSNGGVKLDLWWWTRRILSFTNFWAAIRELWRVVVESLVKESSYGSRAANREDGWKPRYFIFLSEDKERL